MAWDVLKHRLEDQTGDRVQVARERIAPKPQRLKRDGAAAGERIDDQWCFLAMRGLDEAASDFNVTGGLEARSQLAKSPMNLSSAF